MHPKNIRKGKGSTSYRLYASDSCRPTSPEKTARNEGITNPTHFDINHGFPPLGSAENPRQPRVGPHITRPAMGPSNASGTGSRPVSPAWASPKNQPSSDTAAVGPSPKDDSMETPPAATNDGSGSRPVSSEQATTSPKNPPSSATAAVAASPNDDSTQNLELTAAVPHDGSGSRPVSPARVTTSPKNQPSSAAVSPSPKDDSMETPTAATNNRSGSRPVSSEQATMSPKNPPSSATAAVGASPNDDSTQNLELTAATPPDGSGSRPVSPQQVTRIPKNRPSSATEDVGPSPNDDSIKNLETPAAAPTDGSGSLRHTSPDPLPVAAAPEPSLRMNEWKKFMSSIQGEASSHTDCGDKNAMHPVIEPEFPYMHDLHQHLTSPAVPTSNNRPVVLPTSSNSDSMSANNPPVQEGPASQTSSAATLTPWWCEDIMDPRRPFWVAPPPDIVPMPSQRLARAVPITMRGSASAGSASSRQFMVVAMGPAPRELLAEAVTVLEEWLAATGLCRGQLTVEALMALRDLRVAMGVARGQLLAELFVEYLGQQPYAVGSHQGRSVQGRGFPVGGRRAPPWWRGGPRGGGGRHRRWGR